MMIPGLGTPDQVIGHTAGTMREEMTGIYEGREGGEGNLSMGQVETYSIGIIGIGIEIEMGIDLTHAEIGLMIEKD